MIQHPTHEDLKKYKEANLEIDRDKELFEAYTGIKNPPLYPTRRWEYPWVLDLIGKLIPAPSAIIDVGCGGTCFPYVLAKRFPGSMVFGIDSFALDNKAWGIPADVDKFNSALPNLKYIDADVTKVSLGAIDVLASVEVVVSVGVLEHVCDRFSNNYPLRQVEGLIPTKDGMVYKEAQVRFLQSVRTLPALRFFFCTMDSTQYSEIFPMKKVNYDFRRMVDLSGMRFHDKSESSSDLLYMKNLNIEIVGMALVKS